MLEGWTVWKVTAVFYDTTDPLSFLFALISLVPLAILFFVAGLASATPSRQQTAALVLLLGFVHNAVLNAILKSWIKSPRPPHPSGRNSDNLVPSAHGMPSDHAQFIFFFITWLVRKSALTGVPMGLSMILFLILLASMVAYSRVYNSYHYPMQVIIGAAIGITNACLCTTTLGEVVLYRVALFVIPVRNLCTAWVRFIL